MSPVTLTMAIKALHVLSVVLFLGNVITGVFWKLHADLTGDLRARAQALDGVIKSDRWFTVPGVLLIIATGVPLAIRMGFPILGTPWILWSLVLFGISGVVFGVFLGPIQQELLANARAGLAGNWDQAQYARLSRTWILWGTVATGAPVGALFLMVMKPVGA
jgi:uncharacterized membrane protein